MQKCIENRFKAENYFLRFPQSGCLVNRTCLRPFLMNNKSTRQQFKHNIFNSELCWKMSSSSRAEIQKLRKNLGFHSPQTRDKKLIIIQFKTKRIFNTF